MSLPHRSLYREILHDAWTMAWSRHVLWFLAIGTGILQTGGMIDVLIRVMRERISLSVDDLGGAGSLLLKSAVHLVQSVPSYFEKTVLIVKLGQITLLALLFGVAVLVLALLCQGAIVYLLGVRGRFTIPSLREAFSIAGDRFWAVAALNLVPVTAYALVWFALLVPFQSPIGTPSPLLIIAYTCAIILSLLIGFAATALQMLALQPVVLDEMPVAKALSRAWKLFSSSWLTVLEFALLLFAIGSALFVAGVIATIVAILPFFALIGLAIVLQAPTVAMILLLLTEAFAIGCLLALGGLTITFQYAAWHRLYARMQKGLAVAKVIRLVQHGLSKL